MAANVIGHATLNVVPSTKGFGSALKGQIDPSANAAGKSSGGLLGGAFRGAIGPLMAAAGAAGMGMFVAGVTSKASDLNESKNAINVMFGDAADGIAALGKGAAASIGLSNTAFNSLATQFGGAVKNIAGPGGDIVGIMGDLTTRAADFASVMNLDVADAAAVFQSALAGETEGMRRYGVDMSAAAVEAYALANGIGTAGTELTEAQKQQARYGLLMASTSLMQGDFANTSDQLANSQRILGASWQDVQAKLGQGFLPFATAGMQVLALLVPWLTTAGDASAAFGEKMAGISQAAGGGFAGIQAMLGSIGGSILEWITGGGIQAIIAGGAGLRDGLIQAVLTAIPGIATALITMAPSILSAAAASFQSLIGGLLQTLPLLITALLQLAPTLITTILGMIPLLMASATTLFMGIVLALMQVVPSIIMSLIAMLPMLATTIVGMLPGIVEAGLAMFMGIVESLVTLLPVLITAVLALLPVLITTIVGMLPGILESAITMFMGLVTAILTMLPDLITTLVGILPSLVTTIVGMIPTLLTTGIELFITLAKAVLQALPQIVGAIITQVIPALVGAVIGAVPQLIRAGIDLIGGLIQGLWNAAPKVGAAILDIMGDAVDGFLSFLGIHSPSRLFRGYGENVGAGLALGIGSMEGDVASAALGLANAAAKAVDGTELTLDSGVNVAARTAAALAELGVGEVAPHYETTYNDYSTSQEDKQAKLQRAQLNLERSVAATLGR